MCLYWMAQIKSSSHQSTAPSLGRLSERDRWHELQLTDPAAVAHNFAFTSSAAVDDGKGDGMLSGTAAASEDVGFNRLLSAASYDNTFGVSNVGTNALLIASGRGQSMSIAALLENGVDVDTRGSNGATPLMCAAASGRAVATHLLLVAGADVSAEDERHHTACFLAYKDRHAAVLSRLLKGGARFETPCTRRVSIRGVFQRFAPTHMFGSYDTEVQHPVVDEKTVACICILLANGSISVTRW